MQGDGAWEDSRARIKEKWSSKPPFISFNSAMFTLPHFHSKIEDFFNFFPSSKKEKIQRV